MGFSSSKRKLTESENMSAPETIRGLPYSYEVQSTESKKENKCKDNLIVMKFRIGTSEVGKATKILYNIRTKIEGCDLKELNEVNAELYINNKKTKYKTYFIPDKGGIYDIKIKINILMRSCCCLFYSLDNLQSIDLSSFNAEKVTNMS